MRTAVKFSRVAVAIIALLHIAGSESESEEQQSPYTTDDEVERAVARFRSSSGASKPSPQQPCLSQKRKIIAMSLYGREDGSVGKNFLLGAMENGRLAPELYPGWILRVYTSLPKDTANQLREAGIEVVDMERPVGIFGMFWRFFAASDPCAETVIFRDTDSLLNPRERAAVQAWEASGEAMHSMLDSPEHTPWPVQGGMWGIRGGLIPDMEARVRAWGLWKRKLDDMHFLKHGVLPLFADSLLLHSSFPVVLPHRPFPPHPPWEGHVGQQEFLAPYAPSCPTRAAHPPPELLANASSTLGHNGRVYDYLAAKQPPSSPNASQLLAQAATHLAAAESCAQWAVEQDPFFRPGWEALREAVEGNARRRRQGGRCFAVEGGGAVRRGGGEGEGGGGARVACATRIEATLRRLESVARRAAVEAARGGREEGGGKEEEGERIVKALAAAQREGAAAGKWVLCEVSGGAGERLEGVGSCVALALATRRGLAVHSADGVEVALELGDRFASIYGASSAVVERLARASKARGPKRGAVPLKQTQTEGGGAEGEAAAAAAEWREALLCGAELGGLGEEVLRVQAEGWVPVALYRQAALETWGQALLSGGEEGRGQEVAAGFWVGFVGGVLQPGAEAGAALGALLEFARSSRDGAPLPTFIAALEIRTGTPGEAPSEVYHLPHADWTPSFVRCAYAGMPARLRRPRDRTRGAELVWLVVADSVRALQDAVAHLTRSEGAVVDAWPAPHPALQEVGAEMLQFESGARLALLRRAGAAGARVHRLRSLVDMWALASSDLLVATHGSSLASVGRAEAFRRHGRSHPSFAVARDGSCFPWPNDGGPMSWSGSLFQNTSCWSERRHRTYSWSASPPPTDRPPKPSLPPAA